MPGTITGIMCKQQRQHHHHYQHQHNNHRRQQQHLRASGDNGVQHLPLHGKLRQQSALATARGAAPGLVIVVLFAVCSRGRARHGGAGMGRG